MSRACWFCRDTMLQALRFVIQGAGAKVDVVIRTNIVSLLLSMLGHDEVLPQALDKQDPRGERDHNPGPGVLWSWEVE